MGSPTTRDGTGAGGSAPGRVVSPRLLKDRTPLEALASTLRGWTPTSVPGLPSRTRSHESIHAVDAQGREPDGGSGTVTEAAGDALKRDGGKVEKVTWSAWGELEGDDGDVIARRVLLQAYEPSGFVIWDCSSLDSWYEILRLETLDGSLGPDLASRFSTLGLGTIVGATILPRPTSITSEDPWMDSRPLIAIATHLGASNESQVALYSLRSHQVVHVLASALPGQPNRIESNGRSVVLATSAPLALHVLSATTLEPTSFSPIADLTPNPFDGSPVWDLGKGGRALAYATTRPVQATSGAARFDREPARPGAGIFSHRGMFDSDPREAEEHGRGTGGAGETRSAGQVGGEVARKVGEGVLKGAKVIGDMGLNYWQSRSGQAPTLDASGVAYSKSAPLPSVTGWERRGSLPAGGASSPNSARGADALTSGSIVVVDLSLPSSAISKSRSRRPSRALPTELKTIALFRPYSSPIALLSLSPSSSSVLVASAPGHSFDIFELRPAPRARQSTTEDVSAGKVWHRYRLTRGLTTARATTATWAPDGRFVGVGTGKGTTHIFAIQPFGGKPQLENHFAPQMTNATDLPPLSVTLSTVARIRPATQREDGVPRASSISPPSVTFVAKADSQNSSFRPTPPSRLTSPVVSPTRPGQARSPAKLTSARTAFQDLLVYYPHSSLTILERLVASPAPSTTVGAAARGDVGKMATTAVSGLSQLMRSKGPSVGQGAPETVDWLVTLSAKAEWDVRRAGAEGEVREAVEVAETGRRPRSVTRGRFSAQAEIETFSRSPRVLPRSIYLSQQFDFFALPSSFISSTASITRVLPSLRRLAVRSTVQLRPGSDSPTTLSPPDPTSTSASSSPFEPHSFDQPIKSAMQTILDADLSGSPSSAAGFPNGVPGKTGAGRWRETLPLHAAQVNAGLAVGISTVRSGLGLVGRGAVQVAQAGAGLAAARRAGSKAEDIGGSSVSFEDDAVFAEYHEGGTDSTAATSERGSEECEEEDAAWGLDGLNEEDEGTTAGVEGLPFEDDFDDFILDRPSRPSAPDLLLPLALDFDSASAASEDSAPKKESYLLDSESPIVSAPSSFSSSGIPSSASARKGKSKTKRKGGTVVC